MGHEIRIGVIGYGCGEDVVHLLQDFRVDVARLVTEVGRNHTFHGMAIDDMPTAVYLFHYPYAPGNGNFVLIGGGLTIVPISFDSHRTLYSSFSWKTA